MWKVVFLDLFSQSLVAIFSPTQERESMMLRDEIKKIITKFQNDKLFLKEHLSNIMLDNLASAIEDKLVLDEGKIDNIVLSRRLIQNDNGQIVISFKEYEKHLHGLINALSTAKGIIAIKPDKEAKNNARELK